MSDKRGAPVSDSPDPRQAVPTGLGSRAVSGVFWNYLALSIHALGQIIFTVIMSRLVSPEAFGLIAMTAVARGVGGVLSQMGMGRALIQKPTLSDQETRAGVTLSVLFGVAFYSLFWVLAPSLASLFQEPKVVPVIRAASLAFIAIGLRATPESLMRRELRFKELALIHILGFFVGYFVIGVGSALAGAGVWALVFAPIAEVLIDASVMYVRTRHPIRPTLDTSAYRVLLSYGSKISLINLGDFFGRQSDTIVVGRYAGTTPLGIYNRAFYLAVLPLQLIMYAMQNILFASFSRIQSDLPRLKRAYLSSARVSAALFIPASAGIGAAAHELIVVLLGTKYREAVSVVPFLAVYAAMSKMSSLCGVLCESLGELNKRLVLQVAYIVCLAGALLAVAGGPLWVYGAVLAGSELGRNIAYNVLIVRRIIPVNLLELVKVYTAALIAGALVLVAVIATRTVVVYTMGLPPIIALVAEGLAGAVMYILLIRGGPLSFLRKEILSRIPIDPSSAGRNRPLGFVLRVLFGPLQKNAPK